MIPLDDIERAAERIEARVRRTPFVPASNLRRPLRDGATLLKLENLQVTGSFKARGASNATLALDAAHARRGIVTASGGNHGAAVAYAGFNAGVPATVYVPQGTSAQKIDRIAEWGARAIVHGAVWDEAEEAALAHAARDGLHYLHPFADPSVMAGQGTLGLEMLRQAPECDVLVIAVGGGGLIAGVASAVRQLKPAARVIGVEPEGAPTLERSLAAGRPVTLDAIRTRAATLAPKRSTEANLAIIGETVERIVLVDDTEMAEAARWLWRELGIAAELSGAAAVAALQRGRIALEPHEAVGLLVCGAGSDGVAAG